VYHTPGMKPEIIGHLLGKTQVKHLDLALL
jgi:hypothetical protein